MFEDAESLWESAVDELDVRFIDGQPYMSAHTVDKVNDSVSAILRMATQATGDEEMEMMLDMVNGAVFVMKIWQDIHDELCVRAETRAIPDTVPTDLVEKD